MADGYSPYGWDSQGFSVVPVSNGYNFDPVNNSFDMVGLPNFSLNDLQLAALNYQAPSFGNMWQGGFQTRLGDLVPTAEASVTANALHGPEYDRFMMNRGNTTWGQVGRGAGNALALGMTGLGGLLAWKQYQDRNKDRELRERLANNSMAAQNYALNRTQKQDAYSDAERAQFASYNAERAKWRIQKLPNGQLAYVNSETGEIRGSAPQVPVARAARGGLAQASAPAMVGKSPGRLVQGPGTGQSDHIPAFLSNGEYVLDASTVSDIGDGSTEAGGKRLDEMVKKIRAQKRGGLNQLPPKAKKPEAYLKKGR